MFAKFSVKRPLTVIMAVIVVIVLGVVSYTRMTPDLFPSMDFPYAVIVTSYPGASPEKVESEITRPIEQSMATLENFGSVQSTSSNNMSMVVLEFTEDANMDSATVDIRENLDMLEGAWDEMVGTPFILKLNPNIMPVSVAAVNMENMHINELSVLLEDEIIPKLEGVDGVASVDASGMIEETVNVFLTQAKIDSLNEKLKDSIRKSFDDAERQFDDGRTQIISAKTELETNISDLKRQSGELAAALEMLNLAQDSIAQLDEAKAEIEPMFEILNGLNEKLKEYERRLAELLPGSEDCILIEKLIEAIDESLEEYGLSRHMLGDAVAEKQAGLDGIAAGYAAIDGQLAVFGITREQIPEKISEVSAGITQMNAAVPQLESALSGLDGSLAELDDGAAELNKTRTETLDGTDISAQINMNTVSQILMAQNFSMPAGYVAAEEGSEYLVRVGDRFASTEEIENLVLIDLGIDGVEPVKLSDIADVAVTDNSAEIYAKINHSDGIVLSFTKQSTAATAEVSDNINARFEKLSADYPGLTFTNLMDQGDYIYMIVDSVIGNLLWGALFAVIILFLFLKDIKPTFMIAASIPVSLIFAIVLMYFSGVTLNMISLSGLAVGVGMLVDNSVVVIENIYRLRAKGVPAKKAAVAGTTQVAGAIASSTLTTVCVFLPIVFVEGITRQLFTDMALTIGFSLIASLIVALTFIPAVSSGMLVRYKERRHGLFDKFVSGYGRALNFALGKKLLVIAVVILILIGSAVMTFSRGFEFMPEMESTEISLTLKMPEGSDLESTAAMSDTVIERIESIDGVKTVGAMVGGTNAIMGLGGSDASTVTMYVLLDEEAGLSSAKTAEQINSMFDDLDCEVTASGNSDMTSMMGGSGVSLNIYSDDLDELRTISISVGEALAEVEGIDEVDNGVNDPSKELTIIVDKDKAAENGLTVAQVYAQVSAAMATETNSTTLTTTGGEYSVIIHPAGSDKITDETIRDLILPVTGLDGTAKEVALTDVAEISETDALSSVTRSGQRRYLTVSAAVAEGYNVSLVTNAAKDRLEDFNLPEGTTIEFNGENETIMESMEQLVLMMLLAVLLVYIIMVCQFQSLMSPFIVMFTIPLAFTGGLLGLLVTGKVFSVISMIGFVMLAGVIVNNGIVLVDYINKLRAEGMVKREAMIEAGKTRIRPILMTSLTTVLALSITALGIGDGAAMMQPIAIVCIGGLLYATVMTLFVVPVLYDIFNRKELRVVKNEDIDYTEQ